MANRNVHSPSNIYGIRQGFNIADLNVPYSGSTQVLTNITEATVSSPIDMRARSVEIIPVFAKQNTACDIIVTDGNSNVVATFLGITFATADGLNVGGYENIDLQALPFTISVQNIVNESTISVYVKKTS